MMSVLTGLIAGKSWSVVTGDITSREVACEIKNVFQGSRKNKNRDQINSSGYVVDTFEAALWAV